MTHKEALHFFTSQKFGDRGLRLAAERAAEALREIDAAWFMIDHGWDCESREELERAAKTNGFKYGLAQAIHHIGKRCVVENAWMQPSARQCVHGHSTRAIGCVSCVLLFGSGAEQEQSDATRRSEAP